MGHANLKNMSDFFLKRLYAKGTMSIRECIDAAISKGETLHASEGEYDDDAMIGYGLEQVVLYLLEYWENDGSRGRKASPVIEPVELTDEQDRILSEWRYDGEGEDWDGGDDGASGEFGILDSIRWRYCKGWRMRYKEVEPLTNFTN